MKSISGYIFSGLLLLVLLPSLQGQDTLRTYGPRFGVNLAPLLGLFTDPKIIGADASLDFELFPNLYPVFELGFSSLSDSLEDVSYASGGGFAKLGLDYNLLKSKDRSQHHAITVGFRYGTSIFKHHAENITVVSDYWGNLFIDNYENNLNGHWFELVGGMKAEVAKNFFLGWSVRYKILINPNMDPQIAPLLVPGYGNGTRNRAFGFTYSVFYKIPLIKK
ncbi:MAG: DUF6048 family protein [Bacteroides sp.]|nr:DUF6048 family protein [Bacteroides sp.]